MSVTLREFAEKLARRAELPDSDCTAISTLPYFVRAVSANAALVKQGDTAQHFCSLLSSGIAFKHKMASTGSRQIVSLHVPGDLLDFQQSFLHTADHSTHALTDLEILEIDRTALDELLMSRPKVVYAFCVDHMVETSISREWVLNVGRRDGRTKLAHLLCEIGIRLNALGLMSGEEFDLPMTQEQLGDATGLTGVHVNRMLKSLAHDGLIHHNNRSISVVDWNALCKVGDFNPTYLHLKPRQTSTRKSAHIENSAKVVKREFHNQPAEAFALPF